jgi:hypothetical protein
MARDRLAAMRPGPDFGLIHADPVRENVRRDGPPLRMTDVGDGGFGFRLFDLATVLPRTIDEADHPDLGSLPNDILTSGITLTLGTPDPDTARRLLRAGQKVAAAATKTGMTKMHNKIRVTDGKDVITGSPNVSFASLQGNNIESFILIRSPRVGAIFTKYLQMLRSGLPPNSPLGQDVGRAVAQ